jgi:hypothetical protein
MICTEAEAVANMNLSNPTPTAISTGEGIWSDLHLSQHVFWILELSLGCIGVVFTVNCVFFVLFFLFLNVTHLLS